MFQGMVNLLFVAITLGFVCGGKDHWRQHLWENGLNTLVNSPDPYHTLLAITKEIETEEDIDVEWFVNEIFTKINAQDHTNEEQLSPEKTISKQHKKKIDKTVNNKNNLTPPKQKTDSGASKVLRYDEEEDNEVSIPTLLGKALIPTMLTVASQVMGRKSSEELESNGVLEERVIESDDKKYGFPLESTLNALATIANIGNQPGFGNILRALFSDKKR